MTKLNKKSTIGENIMSRSDVTLNEEGGIAFRMNAKQELMLRTVSSLISEDGFYKSGKDLDNDLKILIHTVAAQDPAFVLKLALYARTDMHLRSAPMVLAGEYAMSTGRGKVVNARKYISSTIQRADEITELAAYVMTQNKNRRAFKGKLPMVVKGAIADAFNKFDAYNIAKYNRDGEVTMRDALFMSHPKPCDEEHATMFKQLIDDKLPIPETWETYISTNGSTKENWEHIIPKMGYMALLRNLRNFLDKDVNLTAVLKKISDPAQVARSKQFPFRFQSAYKEIEFNSNSRKTSAVLAALSDALDASVANIPNFTGTTFITCDTSASMDSPVSGKSKVTLKEIGCLFGAMLKAKNQSAITSVFATDHVPVQLNPRNSIITNTEKMLGTDTNGCGTDAYKVMNWLNKTGTFVDRIILFSDMQCYDPQSGGRHGYSIYAGLRNYRRTINRDVFVYSFDLANYGTAQFPADDKRVCMAGGFSDRVLEFIPLFERSQKDMLAKVESITI